MTQDYMLTLVAEAKVDLHDIWHFSLEHFGEACAERYVDSLKKGCHHVIDNPALGRPMEEIGKGVRVYHCQQHVIFYTLSEDKAPIFLAFIHEQRDIMHHIAARLR